MSTIVKKTDQYIGVKEAGGGNKEVSGSEKHIPDYGDGFTGLFMLKLSILLPFTHVQLLAC